jgi:hypothetical protein
MKRLLQIIGVLFIIAGVAGFVPVLCPNGLLFGLFAVNGMHNAVHIVSGVIALAMAFNTEALARNYFRIFGILYGLTFLADISAGRGGMVMGMANNAADDVLHFVLAAIFLWAGFVWHRTITTRGGPAHA